MVGRHVTDIFEGTVEVGLGEYEIERILVGLAQVAQGLAEAIAQEKHDVTDLLSPREIEAQAVAKLRQRFEDARRVLQLEQEARDLRWSVLGQ